MDNELIIRLNQMLKSGDIELRELAVTIFCENTNNYEDYYKLRTEHNSKNIFLEKPQQDCFNKIFNHLDKTTIKPYLEIVKRESKEDVMRQRIGRHELIERSCIIATKEEQSKQSKQKNKY